MTEKTGKNLRINDLMDLWVVCNGFIKGQYYGTGVVQLKFDIKNKTWNEKWNTGIKVFVLIVWHCKKFNLTQRFE